MKKSKSRSRSVVLALSEHDLRVIQSALAAVTPVGGGSDQNSLYHHLLDVTKVDSDSDMVTRFVEGVISDANEFAAS